MATDVLTTYAEAIFMYSQEVNAEDGFRTGCSNINRLQQSSQDSSHPDDHFQSRLLLGSNLLPKVNRKTRNENSQQILESNAITHVNDSQKMKIATAKVTKLKRHVSVPGWPEKTCPRRKTP